MADESWNPEAIFFTISLERIESYSMFKTVVKWFISISHHLGDLII